MKISGADGAAFQNEHSFTIAKRRLYQIPDVGAKPVKLLCKTGLFVEGGGALSLESSYNPLSKNHNYTRN